MITCRHPIGSAFHLLDARVEGDEGRFSPGNLVVERLQLSLLVIVQTDELTELPRLGAENTRGPGR